MKALDPFPRFIAQVDPQPNGCWLWTGRVKENGYAQFSVNARLTYVHRWVVQFFRGPIPPGAEVDHLCHTPEECTGGSVCAHRRCVNPDHLAVTTHTINTLRGASVPAKNKRKTHCKRGHAFNAANTHINRRGHRECRACRRIGGR